MNSALAKLAGFALTLISLALAYKTSGVVNWETYAFVGGAILYLIIAILLGKTFELEVLSTLMISGFITALIMLFVSISFAILMVLISFFLLALLLIVYSEGDTNHGWILK
jgi:hypothetical protein